ncbi:MAG: hypothetical protein ACYDG2_09325 [Ruminiclostridium sp.]
MDKRNSVILNEHTKQIIKWHFNEYTGSSFWLEKAEKLPFDPLKDIQCYEDLRHFPDFSDELRDIDIQKLVPKGYLKEKQLPDIFESGGATGKPKRIIEIESRARGVEWINSVLDLHGFPKGLNNGSWLFIGPSGPHIVGRSMGKLAKLRDTMSYYIDFDPRWVRKCIKNSETAIIQKYINHIVEQVKDIILDQSIGIIFATPAVLERLIGDNELLEIMKRNVKGLIWSGTSFSAESIRYLQEDLFPDAKVLGLYGNTLMGIAGQRPQKVGDKYPAVFHSFFPYSIAEVMDFTNNSKHVDYYDAGQVRITLLTKEMFIPNNMERDQAIRIPPEVKFFTWDGLTEVRPVTSAKGSIIEGVY